MQIYQSGTPKKNLRKISPVDHFADLPHATQPRSSHNLCSASEQTEDSHSKHRAHHFTTASHGDFKRTKDGANDPSRRDWLMDSLK
jgi:hypothetical protein